MANRAVREQLAKDVGQWLTDGLIPANTHALLRERYDAGSFGIAQTIKSFGIAGGMIAFFGLLGLVAAVSHSEVFAAFLLMATGCGLTALGIRLSMDKLARYTSSSNSVLMLGVVCAALGIGLAFHGMDIANNSLILITGGLVLAPVLVLAYRYANTFLLILALIIFFHWVGSWSSMLGRSTYELAIQDPRLMSLAALAVIALGVYHERSFRNQTGRFFMAYETLGLVYLNLSLLILSLEFQRSWGPETVWTWVLFAAAIAQIVAGARLHNPLFTGFGVTIFAVNVFTRYFESCWRRFHTGTFFFLGGLGLFAAGFACEVVLRQMQRQAARANT
ncbi:MAG TPA: hypothetical protein VKG84_13860 [Candidatus Acidoferrales bacterium]|nr:hypothetical protein [Candidatus Acidoferrales bacterium]